MTLLDPLTGRRVTIDLTPRQTDARPATPIRGAVPDTHREERSGSDLASNPRRRALKAQWPTGR